MCLHLGVLLLANVSLLPGQKLIPNYERLTVYKVVTIKYKEKFNIGSKEVSGRCCNCQTMQTEKGGQ